MTEVLFILTLLLSAAYATFLFWCVAGWEKIRDEEPAALSLQTVATIILPARNEEKNIGACLEDFLHQDYPAHLFELVIVDDHSTDRTAEIAAAFIAHTPLLTSRLLKLDDGAGAPLYKKRAIEKGINASSGNLILTTDADCRRGPGWIREVVSCYEAKQPDLISAPVIIENESNWFGKIQSLEFLGLIAIGAASIRNGKPFLCNGANLAFSRKAFEDVKGYSSEKKVASGDDTLLLRKIAARGNDKVHFLKSMNATVRTEACLSLRELLQQRKRWASKIPVQMSPLTVTVALVAYFLHAGLIVSLAAVLLGAGLWVFLLPLLIKMAAEFLLLQRVTGFFKKSSLLSLFLPAQLVYPVYICFVGLASLSGTYEWKDRKVK